MKNLPILWQRLVSAQGTTCPRCHSTGEEVQRAVQQLKLGLEQPGVTPELQIKAIDEASFLKTPMALNQMRIAGKPIAHWLGAQTGSGPNAGAFIMLLKQSLLLNFPRV